MAAGEEFITALVKFVADDSQFNAAADRVEARAKKTASTVDDAMQQAFRRAQGEGGQGQRPEPTGSLAQQEKERVAFLTESIAKARERNAAERDGAGAQDTHAAAVGRGTTAWRIHHQQFLAATAAVRGLAGTLLREVDPALGSMVTRAASAGAGVQRLGIAFGGAAIAGVLIAGVLAHIVENIKAAQEVQVKLNTAFNDLSASGVASVLGEINTKLAKAAVSAESFDKTVTGWGYIDTIEKALGATQLLFTDIVGLNRQAEQAKAKFAVLFGGIELPKIENEQKLKSLEIDRQDLKVREGQAETAGQLVKIGTQEIANAKARSEIEVRNIAAANALELAGKAKEGATPEQLARLAEVGEGRIRDAKRKTQQEVDKIKVDNHKGVTELLAAEIEASEKIQASVQKRADVERQAVLSISAAERDLADTKASFEGRAFGAIEEFQKKRRDLTEQGFREELEGQERATRNRVAAMSMRLTGLEGPERRKAETELTAFIKDSEAERTKILADQAQKRIEIEKKELAERQAAAEQRAKARDIAAREGGLFGGHSIQQELGNLRETAADSDLSAESRLAAAEKLRDRKLQIDEQYFGLLKAMGQKSLVDEVAHQAQIVAQYRQGTSERLDAETKLAEKVKQLREQAASVGESLLTKAAGRLSARGIAEATLADLQQEIADMRREAQESLGNLRAGGTVGTSALGDIFATAGQFKAAGNVGGASAAVGAALGNAADSLTGSFKAAGQSIERLADAAVRAAEAMGGAFGGGLGGTKGGEAPLTAPGGGVADLIGPEGRFGMITGREAAQADAELAAAQKAADEASNAAADALNRQAALQPDMAAMNPFAEGAPARGGEAGTASYSMVDGAWQRSFDKAGEAADRFIEGFNGKIESGTSKIADSIFDTFMDRVVRRLDDESRRQ